MSLSPEDLAMVVQTVGTVYGLTPVVPPGTVPTSTKWTLHASPAEVWWRDVTYAPFLAKVFMVGGYPLGAPKVLTLADGSETWVPQTAAADLWWEGSAWAEDIHLAVAVANNGTGCQVMTSPDLVHWTLQATPVTRYWRRVVRALWLGQFIAVASDLQADCLMTSANGITWTTRTVPTSARLMGVGVSEEQHKLVVLLNDGTTLISTDGVTFAHRTSTAMQVFGGYWRAIYRLDSPISLYVSVTMTGNRIATSPDGETWTLYTGPSVNEWLCVAGCQELGFVVGGGTGTANSFAISAAGTTWASVVTPSEMNTLYITALAWSSGAKRLCGSGTFHDPGNLNSIALSGYL